MTAFHPRTRHARSTQRGSAAVTAAAAKSGTWRRLAAPAMQGRAMLRPVRQMLAATIPLSARRSRVFSGWRPLLGFWLMVLAVTAGGSAVLHFLGPPSKRPVQSVAVVPQLPGEAAIRVAASPPQAGPVGAKPVVDRPPPDAQPSGRAAPASVAQGNIEQADGKPGNRPLIMLRSPEYDGGKETAQRLATQAGLAAGQVATEAAANPPARAVIRFYNPGDHALARRLGRELAQLGYSWNIENFSARSASAGDHAIEVWLPRR